MFSFLTVLIVALELNATLVSAKVTKHLTDKTRMEYSMHITTAAIEHKIDPLLIAAVMYTESNFQNLKENKTHDFGLMQVHWQPRMYWLKGVSKRDLMNPAINIRVGGMELAHMRWHCLVKKRRHKHKPAPWQRNNIRTRHYWWAHYLAGPTVRNRWYDWRIKKRFEYFKRVRAKLRARSKI